MQKFAATSAALALVLLGACGTQEESTGAADVRVEYSVKDGCAKPSYTTAAGTVAIDAVNSGDDSGELEVLEGAKALAEKEDMLPDTTERITVKLSPGTYTLICGKLDGKKSKLVVTDASGAAVAQEEACTQLSKTKTPKGAVPVDLGEWHITPGGAAKAGTIKFAMQNTGGQIHEVVIAKGSVADLEIGTDEVDESVLGEDAIIGELEGLAPGTQCTGEFKLAKGNYVLFCNLVTEKGAKLPDGSTAPKRVAHVAAGMAANFTVTG